METLENTETITYQGEHIEAEKIGEIGGYMGTLRGRQRNGTDHLFRDAEGRYYLRRERFTAIESGGHDYTHEARAAGAVFERTHAINVNAAILWAINLLGLDAFELRRDAAELLMEGRSYFDPQPVHLSPERRAMVTDPDRFAGLPTRQRDATARLPEQVTVPVTMPLDLYRRVLAMGYYDSNNTSLDVSARIVESLEGDVKAWQESGDTNPTPAAYLREFEQELDAGQYPSVYPPPPAVELDAVANAMLRQVCEEGDACRHPGEDPRDLVNAAVTFYLACDNNSQQGDFDVSFGDEALERAKAARLGKERA